MSDTQRRMAAVDGYPHSVNRPLQNRAGHAAAAMAAPASKIETYRVSADFSRKPCRIFFRKLK
jgi:hypothetical protein